MDKKNLKFLIIDDNPADAGILRRNLQKISQFECEALHSLDYESASGLLRKNTFDCIFLDYRLGAESGMEILNKIRESGEDVPIIACTGHGDESVAVELMKGGTQDYLTKHQINPHTLLHAIESSIYKVQLERKLAEKKEELEAFVAVSSHDLKAPLRRITTFSQLLKEEYQPEKDSESQTKQYLEGIIKNASYMNTLIQTLLDYTRLDCPDKKFENIDLPNLVSEILLLLEPLIKESEAEIRVEHLPTVSGDPIGLRQLFQNLITNAIKFRHSDKHPIIHITSSLEDDFWRISVQDNGIGIDQEHHNIIFSPLKRLHGESEYEGTGIGLAICKKVIKRHGGRVWIESEIDKGTTFHFTLKK